MSRHRPVTRRSVTNGNSESSPESASSRSHVSTTTSSSHSASGGAAGRDDYLDTVSEASTTTSTEWPSYLYPKKHNVISMRDRSAASRKIITDEYYQSYDVWTGLRIAATLGGLITLFTLFLLYKSKCKSYKEADLSPTSEDSSSPSGSFHVVAMGAGEPIASNPNAQLGLTYQDPYYLPNQDEPPRARRQRRRKAAAINPDSSGKPVSISCGGRRAANVAILSPSTSSNSASSTNVTSAEVNVVSERQRTPSFSNRSPQNQTSIESENPEPSTSSYQGSVGSDWVKEIVISKRHLWVQYRPNGDSDGAKSEDV